MSGSVIAFCAMWGIGCLYFGAMAVISYKKAANGD
jgi:hypothetical protein